MMTRPDDPEHNSSSEGVDLSKGDQADDPPFDPYRYGKPEHPIPAEYAPPGYTGPVVQTPPAPQDWGPPPGANPTNPFSNPPGTPYTPYAEPPPPGFAQPPPGQYPYPPPPPGYYPPPPGYGHAPSRSNGKAVTALVLGVASIVMCWLSFFDAALVIPGVIFGLIAMNEAKVAGTGRGMAVAGLVCSIVGGLLATLLTVLLLHAADKCGGIDNSDRPGFQNCLRDNLF
jgi:hypothetical protein